MPIHSISFQTYDLPRYSIENDANKKKKKQEAKDEVLICKFEWYLIFFSKIVTVESVSNGVV